MRDPLRTINGRYDLLYQLGEGGMGRVWLAHDRKTGKHVALKVLGKGTGSSAPATALADLRREYAMLQVLQQRGTGLFVDVYELGWGQRENGERFLFYTMEYVRGAHIGHYTWSTDDELVYLFRLLTIVLRELEDAGIVHGDFKPANILVVRSFEPKSLGDEIDWTASRPRPKVLDFGLGQVWRRMEEMAREPGRELEGRVGRSVRWMPPELLAAQDAGKKPVLTERADVYSMGMVWYEVATGRPAFPQKTEAEILAAKRDPSYLPPAVDHLSHRLNELLRWMASPEPEARPKPSEIEASLREASPRVTVDTRSALGSPIRRIAYVGTERAYEVARQVRESLAAPGPRLLVLDGPAGLGKRRLVGELRAALGRETQDAIGDGNGGLVRIHVVELSGAQRPLEQLGPGLAQILDGPAGQEFLVANAEQASGPLSARTLARQAQRFLEAFVASRDEGVVVAVEEIQEVDRDVRSLIIDLAERLVRQPIVVLLVGELETGSDDLRAALRDCRRIPLAPLDEHGTSLFLSRQLGGKRPRPELVDHVHQRSEGLPGRMEEELRALHSDGLLHHDADGSVGLKRPPSSTSGYLDLAARLSEDEQQVLAFLALLKRMSVDVSSAASALEMEPEVASRACRRLHGMGLIAQTEEAIYEVGDVHLARALWDQDFAAKARPRLHLAAAAVCRRWSEERPGSADEMRRHEAKHLLEAGDLAAGAPLALRAASERQSLRYFGQALDLYEAIVNAFARPVPKRSPGGDEDLFHALMHAAPLYKRFERADAAIRSAQQAVDLARKRLTDSHVTRSLLELSRACDVANRDLRDEALEQAWAKCEGLRETDERVVRDVLLERARRFAQGRETREQSLECFERAIAMYREASLAVPPRAVIDLARCRLELFDERDVRNRGLQEMSEALSLAKQQRDAEAEAHAHKGLLRSYLYLDRYAEAKRHAAEGALLFEQIEDLDGKHYCQSNLITLEVLSGPLDRVESHARELIAELPPGHHREVTARLDIAEAAYHVGDYVQALEGAKRWKDHARLPLRSRARRLAARCWAEIGYHRRAWDRFARVKDEVSSQGADLQGGADWENLLNDLEIARVALRVAQTSNRRGEHAMPQPQLISMLERGVERARTYDQDVYGACLHAMLLWARSMEGAEPDPREADQAIERVGGTGAEIAIMEVHYHAAAAFMDWDPRRALAIARQGLHTPGLARDVGIVWRLYTLAGDLHGRLEQQALARDNYRKALTQVRGCLNRMLRHKKRAVAFMRDPHKRRIIEALVAGSDRPTEEMAGAER